jgi:hypothetical protein
MKRPAVKTGLIAILVVAFVASFFPVMKVTTVPAWTIRVVDEHGVPQSEVEVRQHWNHYSFDGGGFSGRYGGEEARVSDSNGEIAFPERSFRTSAAQWAFATIGTPLRWINVHASTGPHASFICLNASCSMGPWYHGNRSELENNVLTIQSDETIKKQLDEIRQEWEAAEPPSNFSEDTAPMPPLRKKAAIQ